MVLEKATIDNSVSNVPKSDQTKEKNIKQNTIEAGLLSCKQNKNI